MNREIDCLIVGSGIGSLTCGALLVQRDWRVLLLTERPLEESFWWVEDGFEHDRSPELYWGLEEEGFLRRLLASGGSEPEVLRLQPGVQVVLPRHRLGLYGLGPEWERELRREFPRSWGAILTCSERLCQLHETMWRRTRTEARGISSWGLSPLGRGRRLQTFLEKRDLEPHFSQMLEALAVACFRVEPSQTTVAMAAMVLGHAQRGFFALRGGARGLVEQLTSQFQARGGEIRMGAVAEVKTKWGQIQRVKTTEGEEVSCRYGVVEPEQAPGKQILYLLVDEVFMPGQVRQNVLVVEPDSQERTPVGLLHLTLGSVGDADDPRRQKRSVGLRILQAPRQDPIILLERAFPGWGTARVCSAPPIQESNGGFLLSPRRRPRNLLVISHETPLGSGLSATAWSGHQVAVRLISQT